MDVRDDRGTDIMAEPEQAPDSTAGVIRPLAFQPDDELVLAIQRGDADAKRRLFERYATHVARVLTRCLGAQDEIADLIQDVFLSALREIGRLRQPKAVKAWLSSIAVFVARGFLRHKRRRRWLSFLAPEQLPELAAPNVDSTARAAIRAAYAVLDTLSDDQRVAFALRFFDQMELNEVAAACNTSLATIKRRLARAQVAFAAAAREHRDLKHWLDAGTRWGEP